MEFETWWLLGVPLFFALGWVAARIDIRHVINESRSLPRNYYKGLIALRKAHPALRISDAAVVKSSLKFIPTNDQLIAYTIDGKKSGDSWSSIVVIHNASTKTQAVSLPTSGSWKIAVQGDKAGVNPLGSFAGGTKFSASPQSTTVLYKN